MKNLFWRVLIIVTIAAIIMIAFAVTWGMRRLERRLVFYLFLPPLALLIHFWKKL